MVNKPLYNKVLFLGGTLGGGGGLTSHNLMMQTHLVSG